MNFKKKYVFSIILLLSLSSCFLWKDDDLDSIKVIDRDSKPSWMTDNKCKGGVCSIGISLKNDSGFGSQVKEAELIGRQNIVAKVKTNILIFLKEEASNLNISNSINFEKMVDTFINKFDLLSIKRNGIYVDDRGTLYINMQLRENALKGELDKFKVMLEKDLKFFGVSKENSKHLLVSIDKLQERLIKK